jgi:hypothetical protein
MLLGPPRQLTVVLLCLHIFSGIATAKCDCPSDDCCLASVDCKGDCWCYGARPRDHVKGYCRPIGGHGAGPASPTNAANEHNIPQCGIHQSEAPYPTCDCFPVCNELCEKVLCPGVAGYYCEAYGEGMFCECDCAPVALLAEQESELKM